MTSSYESRTCILQVEAKRRVSKTSRSPFLNYVRYNRMRKTFPNMRTAIRESSREWRTMSDDDKLPFFLEASNVPRNSTVPPYYMLGEHVLGKRVREQLECFKSSFERHLDETVDRALEKGTTVHFQRRDA